MPKGKRGSKESIRIEFHLKVRMSKRIDLTSAAVNEMIYYWVETGLEPEGVKIAAVTWERSGKVKRARRNTDELDDVRNNMLKRFIHAMPLSVTIT